MGVFVSLISVPKSAEQLKGLVAGTQLDAMRLFKGGRPNRRPGSKVGLSVSIDESLSGRNVVVVSERTLDTMAAEAGDFLYVSDKRWWFGGLRSVHVKAGQAAGIDEEGKIRISPEDAATAHFAEDQDVLLEKIM